VKRRLLIAALLMGAAGAAAQSADSAVGLTVARYFREGAGETLVDGVVRVPYLLLQPVRRGADGFAAYRIDVSVRDGADAQLFRRSWGQRVPARVLATPYGSAREAFTFVARPGRYRVDVTVTDSASGRIRRASMVVDAFSASPDASDLLLATGVRAATGADTVPRAGEVRKGSLMLEAAVTGPVLSPSQSRLGYYVEIYPVGSETAAVALRARRSDGSVVATANVQRVPIPGGGAAAHGTLDLAGLAPGDYRLEVTVGTSGTTRSAPFSMVGTEKEAAAVGTGVPPAGSRWTALTETQLDSLYLPLFYLMTWDEQGVYPSLTLDGKRTYLRDFWAKRDPTPGTVRNEAQEDFYARINEANRRFREGGAAEVPGWRTDRGRIFIRYGAADAVLAQPQAGNTNPYEVWKFTRVKALKYVFMDLTGFGNYALIWTDDIREPSRPNWRELLGSEALLEVERF
jgi:GWxTD domain-containing protein